MSLNFFRPKPGRFGIASTLLSAQLPNNAIADSTTTTLYIGAHPAKCQIERAVVSAAVVPASSGGTILGVLQKYDASANADVTLSGNIDLEAMTALEATPIPLLSTLTPAQLLLDTGDTVRFVITASSTLQTSEEALTVNVELLVQE